MTCKCNEQRIKIAELSGQIKVTCKLKSFHAVAPSREIESRNEAIQTQKARTQLKLKAAAKWCFSENENTDTGAETPVSAWMLLAEGTRSETRKTLGSMLCGICQRYVVFASTMSSLSSDYVSVNYARTILVSR